MRAKASCLFLLVSFWYASRPASAQLGPGRRLLVRAPSATVQVTVTGDGELILFIPSRGRSVEDFDHLNKRLAQAGYQAILPEPRGIGKSTGPLEGITYHDLASDLAATIRSVTSRPVTVIG